jgi:hypothetical protein
MKLSLLKVTVLTMLATGYVLQTQAQQTTPEPVFGSVVLRKKASDSTKNTPKFRLFHPTFFRIGAMGGVNAFLNNANRPSGLMSLRTEYGFSNVVSLLGELQVNGRVGVSFPTVQALLGLNIMPIKSRRLQPFVGASLGIGAYGNRKFMDDDEPYPYSNNGTITDRDKRIQAFGQMRLGLNYVVANRLISTFETSYQLPFNNLDGNNGSILAKIGFAYQLNKTSK